MYDASGTGEEPLVAIEAASEMLMYRSHYGDMERLTSRPTLTPAAEGGEPPCEPCSAVPAWEKPKLTTLTLTVLSLLNLVDCINMNLLTPYAAEMVGDLMGMPRTSAPVLMRVGILIGLYNLSEMIFSPAWGRLSDRIGRRPTILASMGGAALVPIAFGMSQNIQMAMALRAVSGILCGSLGVTKTYVAEIVEKKDEAWAFSIITACYSVGMMSGTALGGALSTPAIWSPAANDFFNQGALKIFVSNPFLLPNLVFSIYACSVWVLVFLFLKESLPREAREERQAAIAAAKEKQREEKLAAAAEEGRAEGQGTANNSSRSAAEFLVAQLPFLTYPWNLLRAIASYGICVSYIIATIQNILLLYQIPVDQHGYGLSTSTLGLLQNCAAAGLLLSQLCLYPRLVRLKGYRWCVSVGLIAVLFVTLPIPLYGLLANPNKFAGVRMVPLVFMMVIQQAAFGFCTPTTTVWINRFAEGLDRGEVNGWANSFAALLRALAPVIVGALQSVGSKMSWDGGRYIALYAISLMAVALALMLLPVLPRGPPAAPKAAEKEPEKDAEDDTLDAQGHDREDDDNSLEEATV